MEKHKKTKTTRTRSSGGFSLSRFSFWLVIIIGATMAILGTLNWLGRWFDWSWMRSVTSWIQSICFILGMFVVVAMSYNVARGRGTAWFIVWIVFVVLVVYGLVSSLIGMF